MVQFRTEYTIFTKRLFLSVSHALCHLTRP
jgi:hypothetical protein